MPQCKDCEMLFAELCAGRLGYRGRICCPNGNAQMYDAGPHITVGCDLCLLPGALLVKHFCQSPRLQTVLLSLQAAAAQFQQVNLLPEVKRVTIRCPTGCGESLVDAEPGPVVVLGCGCRFTQSGAPRTMGTLRDRIRIAQEGKK